MTRKARLVILALGVGLVVVACDGGDQGSSTRSSSETSAITRAVADVDIVSSLGGMGVLPRHVRWTATTSLPPERIKNVLFKVDARRIWIDDAPPFSYGEDEAYLVPASFGIRTQTRRAVMVTSSSFGCAEPTAQFGRKPFVRVCQNPRSVAVHLRWDLGPGGAQCTPRPEVSERSYTAYMVINSFGLWVGRTYAQAFVYELSADARRFHIGVPIFYGSQEGFVMSGLHTQGYQCASNGPSATYGWSWTKDRFGPFNEEHLILEAEQEPCTERQRILEGVWELID